MSHAAESPALLTPTPKTQLNSSREFLSDVETLRARARKQICLLYTSPSPRDGLLSRMPSSA